MTTNPIPLDARPHEVRALQNGATALVRPVEPQPHPITKAMRDVPGMNLWYAASHEPGENFDTYRPIGSDYQHKWQSPFGTPGQTLWVRETHCILEAEYEIAMPYQYYPIVPERVIYKVDQEDPVAKLGWRSPVTMPRWASRLTLRNTETRVMRVWDLSESQVFATGVDFENGVSGEAFNNAEHAQAGGLSLGIYSSPEIYAFAVFLEDAFPDFDYDDNPWIFYGGFAVEQTKGE